MPKSILRTTFVAVFAASLFSSSALAADAVPDDDMPKPLEAYEKAGTPNPEQKPVLDTGHVSSGRYAAAGIMGTVVGFGTGHAIAGVYYHNGLLFTAGELAAVGLFGLGLALTHTDVNCVGVTCTGTTYTPLATYIGPALFGVLKVWEIIDIWTAVPAHNRQVEELRKKKLSNKTVGLSPWVIPASSAGPSSFGLRLGLNF